MMRVAKKEWPPSSAFTAIMDLSCLQRHLGGLEALACGDEGDRSPTMRGAEHGKSTALPYVVGGIGGGVYVLDVGIAKGCQGALSA